MINSFCGLVHKPSFSHTKHWTTQTHKNQTLQTLELQSNILSVFLHFGSWIWRCALLLSFVETWMPNIGNNMRKEKEEEDEGGEEGFVSQLQGIHLVYIWEKKWRAERTEREQSNMPAVLWLVHSGRVIGIQTPIGFWNLANIPFSHLSMSTLLQSIYQSSYRDDSTLTFSLFLHIYSCFILFGWC